MILSELISPVGKLVGKVVDKFWPDANLTEEGKQQREGMLLKLKELEQSGELARLAQETDLYRIDAADRDSARNREIQTHDSTPRVLAYATVAGFFGMVYYMLNWPIPAENRDLITTVMGFVAGFVGGVMTYYFGSSAGSKAKTEAISAALKSK